MSLLEGLFPRYPQDTWLQSLGQLPKKVSGAPLDPQVALVSGVRPTSLKPVARVSSPGRQSPPTHKKTSMRLIQG